MNASSQTESHLGEDRLRRLIDAGRSLVTERQLEALVDRLLLVARELTGARNAAVEGPGDASIVSHDGYLQVPILIRGEPWGRLRLTDKRDGTEPFDEADEEATVALAAWAAIAIDNARVHQEGDHRRAELERSLRALQATSEIAQAAGGEARLWRVLEMIAKQSLGLVEASAVVIMLADGDEFEIAAAAGAVPPDLIGVRVLAGRSAAARVLATGQPERVGEVMRSPQFALGEVGMRPTAALFVPLLFHGLQVGVIEAFDRVDGPHFRPEDERMLVAVGTSAATAVATARSLERDRLRRSLVAAEAERSRWARELHDDTLQGLGVLRVLLSNARRSDDVATLHATLEGAVDQLAQEIANLRSLITELRPAALDELGLVPALHALFERMRVAYGLVIDGRVALGDGAWRLRHDPDAEIAVYRVVQEALTNAARHAEADSVSVEVIRRGAEVRIEIVDDGKGFDVEQPSAGFGLTGMRERISLAGGRLEIRSSPRGTTIHASLPLGGSGGGRD
jgi:signal transduction histidine kinase